MAFCGEICSSYGWDFYVWFCRFWGIITALALWGSGVEALYYGYVLGYYMVLVAVIVTFFEIVFALNYLVAVLQGEEESCCKNLWTAVVMVDNWKKGILYILFSAPCFIQPDKVWLGIISGVLLIISALLYIIKTKGSTEENELDKLAQNATYDRFDEIQEDDIEDTILNPTDDPSPGISLADQQEILEL